MPQDGLSPAIGLPIALVLVLINGFFVAAEFAIVKVRTTRLRELASSGSATARNAELIVGSLDTYLAATQLGITMASLGLGWIGEPAVASVLEPPLHDGLGLPVEVVEVVAFSLGFGLITLLHITLGELAPKSIAILRPEATTLAVTWPLRAFAVVMRPLIFALNGLANAMLRLVGLRPASESELAHSQEELRLLLASSGQHGVLDPIEEELASRSLDLGERTVREIMVPRTEMTAIAADISLEAAQRAAIDGRHDRLPVFRTNHDEVVGYVEWFDLLRTRDPDWAPLIRELTVIPESLRASAALARLRDARAELALVVDEYGGTAGILTLRDILDEIAAHSVVEDGALLPGTMSLHDLVAVPGIQLTETDAATIGGYLTTSFGRIPAAGERIAAGDWDLVVERANDHRVAAARLTRRDQTKRGTDRG
ncbi:MAG TPA: hemolysin family protein [Candidatus Limnocylindrales bacterium]|nr:hemolysin family protein [Candidatus Limnocylindrales bacterium]